MFDRVTLARLNAESVIKEAVSELAKGNVVRYFAIRQAHPDLADRIEKAAIENGQIGIPGGYQRLE